MSYYRECPNCGLNLDPGERCDCSKEKTATGARTPAAASLAKAKPYSTNKHITEKGESQSCL